MTHTNHKNFHIYTAVLMLCILLAACSDSLFDGDGGKLNGEDRTLATSTDFEVFSLMLKKKHNATVSTSTLKRLYNYVGDEHTPRVVTLNVLARYIGHADYTKFVAWLKASPCYDSSFFNAHQLMSSDLNRGDEVEIGWSPNRMVRRRSLR